MPHYWSRGNPVDILGDARTERFRKVVDLCLDDENVDGILIIYAPQAVANPAEIAKSVVDLWKGRRFHNKTILTCFMGFGEVEEANRIFNQNNVPTYSTPEQAVKAYMYMYQYERNLELLYETPEELPVDIVSPKRHLTVIMRNVAAENRELLNEAEAKTFLEYYNIPVARSFVARTPDEAVTVASRVGYPVVAKILSPQIVHKSDAGGVMLDIDSEAKLREAFDQITRRAKEYDPDAEILGVTVQHMLEFLRDEFSKAKETPAYQNTFRRLYLNQWTEQDVRWMDIAKWDACDEWFNAAELRGAQCIIALDLASTTDIAAEALLFPPEESDGIWRVMWRFFVPEENLLKRAKRDRVPYDVWRKAGLIAATEGNICDYDEIRDRVLEDVETYDVSEIVYDRWGATQLITQLTSEGCKCVPFGQGYQSMAAPTKEWEKLVLGRKIAHNGNEVARWMMGNISVRLDPAGNMKPDKSKSTERIDGIVAAIMALGRAMVTPQRGSVYDEGELKVI